MGSTAQAPHNARKVNRDTMAVTFHLIQSGITDVKQISAILGIPAQLIPDMSRHIEPMRTHTPLRCLVCKARINVVPCIACTLAGRKPKYQISPRHPVRHGGYDHNLPRFCDTDL